MTVVILSEKICYAKINMVMIMNKAFQETEQFLQSAVLLILFTCLSITSSNYPYSLLCISGILFIIYNFRSLQEQEDEKSVRDGKQSSRGMLLFIQIIISAVFVLLAGTPAAYLILYELRFPIRRNRLVQIFLPAIGYLTARIFIWQQVSAEIVEEDASKKLAETIGIFLLLFIAALVLFLVETGITKYMSIWNENLKAISIASVNEMYEKKLNQELIIKNYLTEQNARLEERENISRNIHNNVGHSITAAIMTLDAADLLFETDAVLAREKMNTANTRMRKSLDSIRHAVRVLNDENEKIDIADFTAELQNVCDAFAMDTMIRIRMDMEAADQTMMIPREYTEFLTGAVQELLTNGVRHGNADLFTVSLITDSRHIKVIVTDNGKSKLSQKALQEKIENGFGLKKIVAYVKKRGGNASFDNHHGFQSEITLPFYKEEANA